MTLAIEAQGLNGAMGKAVLAAGALRDFARLWAARSDFDWARYGFIQAFESSRRMRKSWRVSTTPDMLGRSLENACESLKAN